MAVRGIAQYEAVQAANNDNIYNECPAGNGADLITFSVSGIIIVDTELNINTEIAMLGPIALSGDNSRLIFRVSSNGVLSLSTLTVQNGDGAGGGTILNVGGTINIAGVSFEENYASSNDGAIFNSSGKLNIAGSNFIANQTDGNGNGHLFTIGNSIVDGGGADNCSGDFTSLGHNIDNGNSCSFSHTTDLNNTDPLLDSLDFNGGPIVSLLTHALLPNSPAIDAADPVLCSVAPVSNVNQCGEPHHRRKVFI